MGRQENSVDAEIQAYLDYNNLSNWRNQVLFGFFRPYRKGKRAKEYWINQGMKGLADRAAILPDGKTLYIEDKTKRKGSIQSKNQIKFEAECKRLGAPYCLARSAKDVSDFLKKYFEGTKHKNKLFYID